MIEPKCPYKLVEVKFTRQYPGYTYRREIIDDSEYCGKGSTIEMVNCYSRFTGDWIGDAKMARILCRKRKLTKLQKAHPDHNVCSIGYSWENEKWYGWSHRAIFGFGIGGKLFEEKFGDDNTPFDQHGTKTIETDDEAKQAAKNFAASVS